MPAVHSPTTCTVTSYSMVFSVPFSLEIDDLVEEGIDFSSYTECLSIEMSLRRGEVVELNI